MSKTLFKISGMLEFLFCAICGIFSFYILVSFLELLKEDGEGLGFAIGKSLGIVLLPVILVITLVVGFSFIIFGLKTYKGATKDYDTYRSRQKGLNVCLILEILIFSIAILINVIIAEPVVWIIWVFYGMMAIIIILKLVARVLIERERYLIHKDRIDNL